MDMKFTFSSQDLTHGLHVSLTGSGVSLTGFTHGKSVAINDVDGQVTVTVSSVEPVHSVAEKVSQVEPVSQVHELSEVQPVVTAEVQDSVQLDITAIPFSDDLFADLVALRRKISSEVKLPPYMIFHDATLREMCKILPSHLSAMKDISGVGTAKLEKYGSRFLEVIHQYVSEGQEVSA
jgi:superfamily II DNA helicase RecQ